MKQHKPVMVEKVIEFLKVQPDRLYIDATCGTGHHTRAILEYTKGRCKVICIDKDERAITRAKEYLADFSQKVIFVNDGFENLARIMKDTETKKADGILFDLGFSYEQISDSEAGFAFSTDGPLDMRYDRNSSISAYDVVNKFPFESIKRIFSEFGEIKDAEKIARLICERRKTKPFETTREFADFISQNRKHKKNIHPATQIFQAIRIYVNNELENIKKGLEAATKVLFSGARLVVISYHSLEDRLVKNFMRFSPYLKVITKKVVVPDKIEKKINPCSRSAKMRVAEFL